MAFFEAEKALLGRKIDESTAEAAAQAAFAEAKPLRDNAYKIPLGKTILKRTILAAAKGA